MADQAASLEDKVSTLNEHISEFSEFAIQNGYSDDFHSIHFIGTINTHEAESALIDHWDEFLQYSRGVLNMDSVPREIALGHIDTINLDYQRTLSNIQNLP